MGVTAHFFAFDPRACATPTTIEGWRAAGALDDELEVSSDAHGWLRALDSPLGHNQRWYDNLAGDFAWTRAREHVAAAERIELDAWFSHLFWTEAGQGCACGREPSVVADAEVVYDDALLRHILALARPLEVVAPALALEFDGDPPKTERLNREWIYDFDGFCELVDAWQRVLAGARRAGEGWSLFRWVWY